MQKSYKIIGENLYNLGFGDFFLFLTYQKASSMEKKD